ncbi:MAG: cytochrome C oxidase subunit IV family protein [Chloroflexi bacterium]|nr:cytochrome C oxidase subunit IV family protein [Chloroflexota bacterium]
MSSARPRERAHPTPARYTAVALVLAVVTIVEVTAVYQAFLADILLPILLVLSATKFALVAMFYMHLRFDHRLFSALFVGGLLLTAGILIALLALFRVIVQ